ncbi:hypothetical protein LCGC14_2009380 [marine sediment metagenome]|uniref:Uncharacterized protein n=1 Tax=marine sediment metagenome TaxID=412755 RepID=A0A0F9FN98_9ZZZZ
MIRLTKELVAMSFLQGLGAVALSNELDFNLARRSGLLINHISSQITSQTILAIVGNITNYVAQEVDLDPDNIDVQTGAVSPASVVETDSSRVMRHQAAFQQESQITGTDGGAGFTTPFQQNLEIDFRMMPLEERPISITSLRHNMRLTTAGTSGTIGGLIVMRYIIVELSLQELGIINAGRR